MLEQSVDTLRGNLELFGLEAIAGLLTSTRKTGALRVAVDGLNGRLFFVEGALVYATTRTRDGSVNDLRGRGTELRDRRRTWTLSLPELLRHQITDVLVRIIRRDGGEFSFDEGVTTTALPKGRTLSFNAAEMIHRAQERLGEWRAIEEAIPDSSVKYRLTPDLPSNLDEITVDGPMWTFFAAVGDGASAGDIAERLRIFEFPAAQKMAEFVRRGMLVPVDAADAARALRETRAARSAFTDDEPGHPDERITNGDGDSAGEDDGGDVRVVMGPPTEAAEPIDDDLPTPVDDDPFGAETASHALAEWGEAEPRGDFSSIETGVTTEAITDVGPQPVPASTDTGDAAAAAEAIDHANQAGGPESDAHRQPSERGALPQVPSPPPWVPDGPANPPLGS